MKNKSIYKILFYTILVFCISAFSYFPKSYSKYLKDELEDNSPARFHVNLDKLYVGDTPSLNLLSNSNYETANYEVKFDIRNLWKSGDTKQQLFFEIEQENACKITSVTTKGTKAITNNQVTITYTEATTDSITVNYSCNVTGITVNNEVYTNIKIYEQYSPENIKYLYAKADGVKMLLTKYYESFPIPKATISDDGKTLTIPGEIEDKYSEFTTWINKYSTISNYSSEVITYIKTMYNSEEDILNSTKSLKGLTYTYNAQTGQHIYQIDDNLIGYARTYYANIVPDDLIKVVFSNSNLTPDQYNEIFKYYLETYGNYTEEEITKIMNYISSYGSVKYIMTDGNYEAIKGLTYLPETETYVSETGTYLKETGEILFSVPFMNYVDIFYNQKIELDFDLQLAMYIVFSDTVKPLYGSLLSDELIDVLLIDGALYDSLGKNATDINNKPTAYTDYLTFKDPTNNNYVMVIISSDGVATTSIEIINLGEVDTLVTTQTVTEDTNTLSISLTNVNQDISTSKPRITDIMTNLDIYFGTNYKDELVDELFTTSTTNGNITSVVDENNVVITYTISIPGTISNDLTE